MAVEQFADEAFEAADLAAGGAVSFDERLEPLEAVCAGWGRAGSGSIASRRRSRASILPLVVSWSRISVGSLEIWSATWCKPSVRAATSARRCSNTASISATRGS